MTVMTISTTVLAAVGAALATVAVASPAAAREACNPAEATCTSSVSQGRHAVVGESSPYAEALDGLGGHTLAQHLSRHNDSRLTVH